MNDCRAMLEENTLILENSRIRRTFDWNHGHLVSREIADKAAGQTWTLTGSAPDCSFPGEAAEGTDGELRVTECPATPIRPAHLQADVTMRLGGLEILRRFRIYPDCPAIACDFYLRGRPSAAWGTAAAAETGLANVESIAALYQGTAQAVVIDRLQLPRTSPPAGMRPVLRRDRPAQHAGDDAQHPALSLRGAAAGQPAADPRRAGRPGPVHPQGSALLRRAACLARLRLRRQDRRNPDGGRRAGAGRPRSRTSGRAGMAAWSAWRPAASMACSRRCGRTRSRSASTSPAATR